MPLPVLAMTVADTETGMGAILPDGRVGTMTARRDAEGLRMLHNDATYEFFTATDDVVVIIDPTTLDGVGGPVWGEADGCTMGVEMGCDGHPGCIGECGSL